MSRYVKYLVVLFLILAVSDVNADVVWPALYIVAGRMSLWVIVGGLLVETGFVKYYTKENWGKTILVSVIMNLATGTIGNILIAIFGVVASNFHIMSWIIAYFLATVINTAIESSVIWLMLKLKFEDTYKWVFVANAISILMCAIYVVVADVNL